MSSSGMHREAPQPSELPLIVGFYNNQTPAQLSAANNDQIFDILANFLDENAFFSLLKLSLEKF